jgi:anaerobic magnesium-protoporphyrin IX monomethyl ester cyclase
MKSSAAITLLNMNMLYVRYADSVERELHVPLGTLYLTRVLEDAGCDVDFRDYQLNHYDEPFSPESVCDFLADSYELVGVSVMANLLPFTLLALQRFKTEHPQKTIVLGGVGGKAVEQKILTRFPWIDAVAYGEGERMIEPLVRAFAAGATPRARFGAVPNLYWRDESGRIIKNDPAPRIEDLDTIAFPAWHRIDLERYDGYGVMASRGCPYPCTFCSVAPVWDHTTSRRSDENIVAEMKALHDMANVDLFLFQDEYFVCTPRQVEGFCRELERSKLGVDWKAFGRVNLSDRSMMKRMADTGCLELRFGIESGSDAVLQQCEKGFRSQQAIEVVGEAISHFDRVDTFYVWGFPFESMQDFQQSLFQMVAFRMMGARVLPSLLSFLPQTTIFRQYGDEGRALDYCRELFPEYMITGHEICESVRVDVETRHAPIFDFIAAHPDIFPGFFHYDLQNNVLPKLAALQEMGFYPTEELPIDAIKGESCGGHSPRVAQATTARAQLSAS